MIASQFADLSKRIFPKLQNIVEKERGERNGAKKRTYYGGYYYSTYFGKKNVRTFS